MRNRSGLTARRVPHWNEVSGSDTKYNGKAAADANDRVAHIYPEFEEQNAPLLAISHFELPHSPDEQQEFLLGIMGLMRKQKYEG